MRLILSPPFILILLASLLAVGAANYGREEKELAPHAPITHPKPEVVADDASVRADDESLKKIETEREQLAKKLRDIENLRQRMNSKHELLRRVQTLQSTLSQQKKTELDAKAEVALMKESYHLSEQKKNATWDAKEQVAEQRRSLEKLLDDLKQEKSQFDVEYDKMDSERKKTDARERELELERKRLLKNVETLVHKFKSNGFHLWLERNVDALPALVKETILKSSDVLDPVLERVGEVAGFNEQLTNETTEAITRYLPAIRNSPFYTGLIFYIMLLFPLVAAVWLVMKVRARLSLLTVEHYLIALNLYFGVLSVVCAVMTILGRTDILIVFRHRARSLAESFMIIHAFLFLIHLILHGMTAYVSGARKDFTQYICMSCIGLHFFMNAYKRTILDQDPNIGAPAYVIYSSVFLYTLYDRGVHVIEAAMSDRKADTSAFATYPADQSHKLSTAHLPTGDETDKTVYFAGLPVFNAPAQVSLNDAKTI